MFWNIYNYIIHSKVDNKDECILLKY